MVALVRPGCWRDIPSADGEVSFGRWSEANRQKWDFQAFFSQTASDPQWQKAGESLHRQGSVAWGYAGSVEWRSSSSHLCTEDPFISALFDPNWLMVCVCVVCLVLNYSGRLMFKVTEGVLFHGEIERGPSHLLCLIIGSLWSHSLKVQRQ